VNRHITRRAGKLSKRGKFNWLKDIQSVTPMTRIPDWMISNYFYREMSPLLRYSALPFLLLFQVSALYLLVLLLDVFGVWSLPDQVVHFVLARLSVLGALVDAVLWVNIVVIVPLGSLSIPIIFLARDVQRTLGRFGLVGGDDPEEIHDQYLEAARGVFEAHPEVAAFIYGHTHRASITEIDDRVVVNTGTWLKRLQRKSVVLGLLPRVFYPSYLLNYVRIFEEDGSVVVEYQVVENPTDLTLLERLLTRRAEGYQPIPERTVVDGARTPTRPVPEQSTGEQPSTGEGIED